MTTTQETMHAEAQALCNELYAGLGAMPGLVRQRWLDWQQLAQEAHQAAQAVTVSDEQARAVQAALGPLVVEGNTPLRAACRAVFAAIDAARADEQATQKRIELLRMIAPVLGIDLGDVADAEPIPGV